MAKKEIIKKINDTFGSGTIFRARSVSELKYSDNDFLSSGSLELNRALSSHHSYGMKRGRIMEIYGPYQSGKTTTALHFAAQATKKKINVAFMDLEHALDTYYAEQIGIDMDYFYICQPECAEDAFEISWGLLKEKFELLIYDSVPSLVPRAEIEGSMDDAQIGAHARVMGKGLRKLTKILSDNRSWAIFINQLRANIGVFYGPAEDTPGGKALKYYSSYRLDVRSNRGDKIEENKRLETLEDIDVEEKEVMRKGKAKNKKIKKKIKSEKSEVGIRMTVKVVKNKVSVPYKKTSIKIIYGKGIENLDDLLQFLTKANIIKMESPNAKKLSYEGKSYMRATFEKELENNKFKSNIKKLIEKSGM